MILTTFFYFSLAWLQFGWLSVVLPDTEGCWNASLSEASATVSILDRPINRSSVAWTIDSAESWKLHCCAVAISLRVRNYVNAKSTRFCCVQNTRHMEFRKIKKPILAIEFF
jgi:hypothetical protein